MEACAVGFIQQQLSGYDLRFATLRSISGTWASNTCSRRYHHWSRLLRKSEQASAIQFRRGDGHKNFLPSSIRKQIVADSNSCFATDPHPDDDCQTPSNTLATLVDNPFKSLFVGPNQGPNPIFNEPSSIYKDAEIPLINVLRPSPSSMGSFSSLAALTSKRVL